MYYDKMFDMYLKNVQRVPEKCAKCIHKNSTYVLKIEQRDRENGK